MYIKKNHRSLLGMRRCKCQQSRVPSRTQPRCSSPGHVATRRVSDAFCGQMGLYGWACPSVTALRHMLLFVLVEPVTCEGMLGKEHDDEFHGEVQNELLQFAFVKQCCLVGLGDVLAHRAFCGHGIWVFSNLYLVSLPMFST